MFGKMLIIALVIFTFLIGVAIVRAQTPDPLLEDARYYQQIRNALTQEQRANTLQIQILERRQEVIKNLLSTIDAKIKELNAVKDMVEPPPANEAASP